MKGALIGGAMGALTFGIGQAPIDAYGVFGLLGKAAMHGIAQGGFAELQGGDFLSAFSAASFSKIATGALGFGLGQQGLNLPDFDRVVAQGVGGAVIGGTASLIGGGKFQNGAATAAFVYLFNELSRPEQFTHQYGTMQDLKNALLNAGDDAFVFGVRPLAGVVKLDLGAGSYMDQKNLQGYHENMFLVRDGEFYNYGFFSEGVQPDPGFPGNIASYMFGPIRPGMVPDSVFISSRFTQGTYDIRKNNCQDFCSFVRDSIHMQGYMNARKRAGQ